MKMKVNIIMAQMRRVFLLKRKMSVVVRVVSQIRAGKYQIIWDSQINLHTGNIKEAIIGPIKVKVLCGDITKETTDVIVSSTNTTLNLGSGTLHIYSICQYVLLISLVLNKAKPARSWFNNTVYHCFQEYLELSLKQLDRALWMSAKNWVRNPLLRDVQISSKESLWVQVFFTAEATSDSTCLIHWRLSWLSIGSGVSSAWLE